MKPEPRFPSSHDLAIMRRAIADKYLRKRKPTMQDIQMRALVLEAIYTDPHIGYSSGIAFPEETEHGSPASWSAHI